MAKKNFMFKFFSSCYKIWILFHQTITSIDEDIKKLEVSCFPGGNVKSHSHFAVSLKVKQELTIGPCNSTSLPQRNKTMSTPRLVDEC